LLNAALHWDCSGGEAAGCLALALHGATTKFTSDKLDSLPGQMKQIEKEMLRELSRKETQFFYKVKDKKIQFTEAAKARNKKLMMSLHRYLLGSRFTVVVTTFVIWTVLAPIALLDLIVSFYQLVCFPIYQIPKVIRSDYVLFDRHRLSHLNLLEKQNCEYCAYANGILGYAVEIAARTEQHFCPIRHALRIKTAHSRYKNFLDYGDAEHYRQRIEEVRRNFADLKQE